MYFVQKGFITTWLSIFIVVLALFLSYPNSVKAYTSADFPSRLLVEWQPTGSTILTTLPIFSWNNPVDSGNINTLVVRVGKTPELNACSSDYVFEHWFTSSQSPTPCSNSVTTTSSLTKGSPPKAYITTPASNLLQGERYYWAVLAFKNGKWFSSTGYISGEGGNAQSVYTFQIQTPTLTKNIYGANVFVDTQIKYRNLQNNPQASLDLINLHLDWAKSAFGDGGNVKFYFHDINKNTQNSTEVWKQMVSAAYQRNLVPILRLQGDWVKAAVKPWDGFNIAPTPDSNGRYTDTAQGYKRLIADLPKSSTIPLIIELGNEMNADNENWGYLDRVDTQNPRAYRSDPVLVAREYAKFYVDVYKAIKELNDPSIKVMIAGFGRCGDIDFIKELMKSEEIKQYIVADGYWATHIYPKISDNLAEEFQSDLGRECNLSPLGYKYQLDELARAGVNVSNTKVIVTEGGYFRTSSNGISEDKQAELVVRLYDLMKLDSARVDRVALFSLDAFTDPDVLDLTNPEFDPTKLDSFTDGGLPWVYLDSKKGSGNFPDKYHKVYSAVTKAATGVDVPDGSSRITPLRYRIANTPQGLDNAGAQGGILPLTSPINLQLDGQTQGIKTIFVRFYYSNGQSIDKQQSIVYNPTVLVSPTPVPTLGPSVAPTSSSPSATPTSSSTFAGYYISDSPSRLPADPYLGGAVTTTDSHINLTHNFPESSTKTTYTLFVRFYYLNGGNIQYIDKQQSIIYNPTPITTPASPSTEPSCPSGTVRQECIGYASNNINTYCWSADNSYIGGICTSGCAGAENCTATPTQAPVASAAPSSGSGSSCPSGTVREECIGYASNNINTYCWGADNSYLGGKCSSTCSDFDKCGN